MQANTELPDEARPPGPPSTVPNQREPLDDTRSAVATADPATETPVEAAAGTDARPEAEAAAETEPAPQAVTGSDAEALAGDEQQGDEPAGAGTFVGFEDSAVATEPAADSVLVAAFAPVPAEDVAPTSTSVWQAGTLDAFRERIREAQVRFVDEPPAAVAEIRALVSEAAHTMLAGQLDAIDPHRHSERPDTESLRLALRQYRDLLDRLLAL